MLIIRSISLVTIALGFAACSTFAPDEDIALSDVPAAALDAANGAVDGIEFKGAEMETKKGRTVYELKGKANGVKHEVKVTADGEVLKVETDD